MKKIIFVTISLLLLAACNSDDDGYFVTEVEMVVPNTAITSGDAVQLQATALYSDGQKRDVTNTVEWVVNDPSVVNITESGLMTRVEPIVRDGGEAETFIHASLGGIKSQEQLIYSCNDLSGNCLSVVTFELDGFIPVSVTSSPSLTYAQNVGFDTGTKFDENGTTGPAGGEFLTFNRSQAEEWCTFLSDTEFMGKTDWHVMKEISLLNMFNFVGRRNNDGEKWYQAYGWPLGLQYWSLKEAEFGYSWVFGFWQQTDTVKRPAGSEHYATCASGQTLFMDDSDV